MTLIAEADAAFFAATSVIRAPDHRFVTLGSQVTRQPPLAGHSFRPLYVRDDTRSTHKISSATRSLTRKREPGLTKWYDRSMRPSAASFILGKDAELNCAAHSILILAVGMALSCANSAHAGEEPGTSRPPIVLEDVAANSGISFQFENGSRGKHDLPEIMGGGVALFDADGDGLLDVYLCNGGPIEPGPGKPDPPCRLFRNRGGWHFEDITNRAAAPGPSYAMGAAVGDYDGDGRADLFVTGWRDQRLYRNLGNCRFEDVTGRAGLTSSLWSTSAAFADLDGDGDLDLYVANYLDYDAKSAAVLLGPGRPPRLLRPGRLPCAARSALPQ